MSYFLLPGKAETTKASLGSLKNPMGAFVLLTMRLTNTECALTVVRGAGGMVGVGGRGQFHITRHIQDEAE